MDWQGWLSVFMIIAVLGVLVFSSLSSEFVLMTALVILNLCGVLKTGDIISGFSNSGLITVAAMFIVAAGIRDSGGVDILVKHILGKPKGERWALARLVLPTVTLSAFLNNTPLVATMIPAVNRWSKQISVAPSRLMIPLSFASIIGGTITLIGTSTNLVVNGLYKDLTGNPGFKLFDITPVGLVFAAFGALYLVFMIPLLLPKRGELTERMANPKQFTFEVAVAMNGPLVGKTVEQAGLRHLKSIFLLEIERHDSIVTAVTPEERLQGGDRLVFIGESSAILDVLRINGLVASDSTEPVISKNAPERCLMEVVVSGHCECIGQSIRNSRFRNRYGAVILAVARNGEPVTGNLGSIEIEAGDLLLIEARPDFVTQQRAEKDFLLINDLDEEKPKHNLAVLSWVILVGIVGLATFDIIDMLEASLIGAVLMIATNCCSITEARRSLDLNVIITIAASFGLGKALEVTGAAAFIGQQMLAVAGNNPLLILAMTYIVTAVLTEVITNNAAAAMVLPIALAMTKSLNLHAEPFVIAVMFAASASFSTPLGYQTNLMVMGPGGYKYGDYFKVGIPMNVLAAIVTVVIIPLFWPLQ